MTEPRDPERAEALRRRLYRPGASLGDVDAFVAAQLPAVDVDAVAPGSSRRRVPAWLVASAVLVLTAATGATAWGLSAATAAHAPAATPLPTAAVAPAVRAAFVRSLVEGRDAGLSTWLAATGVRAQEDAGAGPGAVEIVPPAQDDAGRMTVYLVLESDAKAAWAPARLEIDSNRTIHRVAGRARSGTLLAGIPAVGSTPYAFGAAPVRVLVRAPKGVRWGLAAVFDQR